MSLVVSCLTLCFALINSVLLNLLCVWIVHFSTVSKPDVRPGACEREAGLRIQRGTLSHFSSGPAPQKDNLGSNDEQTDSERGRQKDEQMFG